MSTPPPNESESTQPTQPTGRAPPTIPIPTTQLGALQTMMSLFPHLAASQGGGSSTHAVSPQEITPDTYAPTSGPQAPVPVHSQPAHATQFASDITVPAPVASVSSHGGRTHSPPRTARVTRTISAIDDPSYHPPRPVIPPLTRDDFRYDVERLGESVRVTAVDAVDEVKSKFSFFKTKPKPRRRTKRNPPYGSGTVGARLEPTVEEAEYECDNAEWTATLTTYLLHIATGLQILIGALTTALGAALSGKNTSVAISTLGGASTLVASYLARARSTNEPEKSRERAANLKHFLREITAFQLDHGEDKGFNDDIKAFRSKLERMLGNGPQMAAVQPNSGEKGGATNTNPKGEHDGMSSSGSPHPKLGYMG